MKSLFEIGSRVKCGDSHKGVLVAYFTAAGFYENETELYAVMKLNKPYTVFARDYQPEVSIPMLIVHVDNLERERI